MSGTAFLFPGQGSQSVGMGRALYDAFPEVRDWFEAGEVAAKLPLRELCFRGPEAELRRTEVTQPAILLISVAVFRLLAARGLRPDRVAGHSLGEYSALVAAGALALADALPVVRARGRFMQEAVPEGEGAMAAILGLDAETVAGICREAAGGRVVAPANWNGAAQVVISGHRDAVERAAARAREAGARRVVLLPVSAPFHCPLMEPAAARLAPMLDRLPLRDLQVPLVTNADARPIRTAPEARDALKRQVTAPVRWEQAMQSLLADGVDTFVEVGPGTVLSGLARRMAGGARVLPVGDPAGVEAAAAALVGTAGG